MFVVLEKGEDQRYLCNSRYTYGTFHINFTDVGADEDVLVDKIEACTDGLARKDLEGSCSGGCSAEPELLIYGIGSLPPANGPWGTF